MSELLQSGGYRPLSAGMLNTPEGVEMLNSMFQILFQNFPGDMESRNILYGIGTPEGNVTASVGALFFRTDGGAGTTLYVKESGSGNTGWVAMDVVGIIPLSRGGTGQDLSTNNQGDIYYDNGTNAFARLTPGTSGQYLKTQGAGANPTWGDIPQGLELKSVTTATSATNSGDITIAPSKQYMVTIHVEPVTTTDSTLYLRFGDVNGADSGASDYNFVNELLSFEASPVETLRGSSGSGAIEIGNNIGRTTLATAGFEGILYIDTYKNSSGTSVITATVDGRGFLGNSSGKQRISLGGIYLVDTTITHFELVTSQNADFDIKVFELKQSV